MTDESKALTFPTAMPGGEIVPYLSPKQRSALFDYVYRETGGAEAMVDWVKRSDENRRSFYGWYSRMTARPAEATDEEKNKGSIEDLLARLDAGENATVINVTPVTIEAGDDE